MSSVTEVTSSEELELNDFYWIKGQEHAKRALEVAAAGGHNVLMIGPPGAGKTMLQAALESIRPEVKAEGHAKCYTGWPCACGYYGDACHKCTCDMDLIMSYRREEYFGFLDSIDVTLECSRLPVEKMVRGHWGEKSAAIAARVQAAAERAIKRQGLKLNSQLGPAELEKYCGLTDAGEALITRACERLGLSMRAYCNILKVSRTIADLDGSEVIEVPHLAEAIQYRSGEERLRG